MMKKQHYMTRDERQQLEALLKAKIPVAQIARQLGFCRQTIYNEMERGAYIHTCEWWDEVRYSADKAQQLHDQNQTAKGGQLPLRRHWPQPERRGIRPPSAQPRYTATSRRESFPA